MKSTISDQILELLEPSLIAIIRVISTTNCGGGTKKNTLNSSGAQLGSCAKVYSFIKAKQTFKG